MKIKHLLCALFVFTCPSFAEVATPRTWTSADGRKIEATYIGRAEGGALVLVRADTQARVTVPLAALSPDDQAHAATLPQSPPPAPPADIAAKNRAALVALAAAYPAAPAGHADAVEWARRYDPLLRGLASGDVAANCRALRARIERDLPIASGPTSAHVDFYDKSPEADKKRLKIRTAEQIVAWLKALNAHAAKVEAEAAK